MTGPVAFYAPLKSPRHAVPSGDRTVARLMWRALEEAGFAPFLASELRTLDLRGDPSVQAAIRDASHREADGIVAAARAGPAAARPRAWFTYHCYFKAPDWIGPRVADALGIPYVVAEGSRAAKRAAGAWALGHAGAEVALDRADLLLPSTPRDAQALRARPRLGQAIHDLPPFLDATLWPARTGAPDAAEDSHPPQPEVRSGAKPGRTHLRPACFEDRPCRPPEHEEAGGQRRRSDPPDKDNSSVPPSPGATGPVRLLAVAMMRAGDKGSSYRLLADALGRLDSRDAWTLTVVGDGPEREAVYALFAPFGQRVSFKGAIEGETALAALYREADLLVWPAVNEAYGMTLLEAQAAGCPVLAGQEGGVSAVVKDGETGLLVRPRDPDAFAAGLASLLAAPEHLASLGAEAARFVRAERDLPQAARRLRQALLPLLDGAPGRG